jgi:hypothetical protein
MQCIKPYYKTYWHYVQNITLIFWGFGSGNIKFLDYTNRLYL